MGLRDPDPLAAGACAGGMVIQHTLSDFLPAVLK